MVYWSRLNLMGWWICVAICTLLVLATICCVVYWSPQSNFFPVTEPLFLATFACIFWLVLTRSQIQATDLVNWRRGNDVLALDNLTNRSVNSRWEEMDISMLTCYYPSLSGLLRSRPWRVDGLLCRIEIEGRVVVNSICLLGNIMHSFANRCTAGHNFIEAVDKVIKPLRVIYLPNILPSTCEFGYCTRKGSSDDSVGL